MVWIKICGITRDQDAQVAVESGADALGFVFFEKSKRYVSVEQAAAIIDQLPGHVTPVGLFVNAQTAFVQSLLDRWPGLLPQFHGDESPEFCEQFNHPYLRAVRMKPDVDLHQIAKMHPNAQALLLDAFKPGEYGGTGETFDWSQIPDQLAKPIILAGGLNPQNVSLALGSSKLYGVDVSGGVEASAGKKDPQLVRQFIQGVKGD
ncbi:phosphoribosylanthranilate isomerase [Pelagibaculum spongiae]|uniref:N-(5'-phosphoribosyl)anthranilate isomerase n=1 Tax=Pelagibaculum spongiae TaxID=2080658 RepID=A0A2V1H151_9GAMM|nr:phosphoribosylanthranilate isomerase [Pelagibaculum spongiae]PVZ71690.1 phosphoribosylanthranilate isomerase [Pelagibaculum spongiae]